jgi:nicotinamide-nucleotide amidase
MTRQNKTSKWVAVLSEILMARGLRCAVAESCTGGRLADVLTERPGSSQWFDRGFVTYSNEAKEEMLGVSKTILEQYGAVSEPTAQAMASGAMAQSHAQVSVSITGIAGPSGGTPEKPVGTVWIAWAGGFSPVESRCYVFSGNRLEIRERAVQAALQGLIQRILS